MPKTLKIHKIQNYSTPIAKLVNFAQIFHKIDAKTPFWNLFHGKFHVTESQTCKKSFLIQILIELDQNSEILKATISQVPKIKDFHKTDHYFA